MPMKRRRGGPQREAAQRDRAAQRRRAGSEEQRKMAGFLSMAEAAQVTGISKYRIGAVVKQEGLPTYVAAADRRKKWLREADVGRLMTPEARPEGPAGAQETP